ncbi:MAG: UDP-N-acetylmuramoyl-L-alanyl-D-glutamate--2,6-diaminopimelate ligase [Deltaproteobacteria bacterium]|nr:UDP-N-acetylmuramoyl-L-alanyl-D-glutamate--2,6-diaminopimelate ligase [Deltaproteobacteria bacterium]
MRVSRLTENILPLNTRGPVDMDITGICYDSRKVLPGDAFFALRGALADGHDFVATAVEKGARAVFAEKDVSLPDHVAGIVVADTRMAMAQAAVTFYGNPASAMTLIGVTGTNGKTTVCYELEAIFKAAGRQPAVFGTVNYRFGEIVHAAPNTTPESADLIRMMAEFRAAGADILIMEVSSHGIDQHRIDGLLFNVGVFTNLSPEHLDYHHDMESYFAVKKRFFTEFIKPETGMSVINIDDPYGLRLTRELKQVWRCGCSSAADISPTEVKTAFSGTDGFVSCPQGDLHLTSKLFGSFNISNLMVSAGAALAAGIELGDIERGLAEAPQVPGRLEAVENDRDAFILVDYAHTADALKNVLTALKELNPPRLLIIFGCGGDRDRSKRPEMGSVAASLADIVILTSDNPRSEDPEAILGEVRKGIEPSGMTEFFRSEGFFSGEKGFITIADRREAIRYAVSLLVAGDVLLVAGKGHEDYQIIGNKRLVFNDKDEIILALNEQEVSE